MLPTRLRNYCESLALCNTFTPFMVRSFIRLNSDHTFWPEGEELAETYYLCNSRLGICCCWQHKSEIRYIEYSIQHIKTFILYYYARQFSTTSQSQLCPVPSQAQHQVCPVLYLAQLQLRLLPLPSQSELYLVQVLAQQFPNSISR